MIAHNFAKSDLKEKSNMKKSNWNSKIKLETKIKFNLTLVIVLIGAASIKNQFTSCCAHTGTDKSTCVFFRMSDMTV